MELEPNLLDWNVNELERKLELEDMKRTTSQESNIAFLLDWAQMSDLDFGLIQQNISIKKASFHY